MLGDFQTQRRQVEYLPGFHPHPRPTRQAGPAPAAGPRFVLDPVVGVIDRPECEPHLAFRAARTTLRLPPQRLRRRLGEPIRARRLAGVLRRHPHRASSSPIRTTAAVSPSRNWPFSALNPAFSTSNSSYEGRRGTCGCSGTQRSKHVTNRINPHDTPTKAQLPHRPRARTDQPRRKTYPVTRDHCLSLRGSLPFGAYNGSSSGRIDRCWAAGRYDLRGSQRVPCQAYETDDSSTHLA